ncbi:MAG: KEOPS complex subunit Pcc1 [archaeon]
MRTKAEISIPLTSRKEAQSILQALNPETRISFGPRSKVNLRLKGRSLQIIAAAKDVTALRAILNSYLRWISGCSETISTVKETYATQREPSISQSPPE